MSGDSLVDFDKYEIDIYFRDYEGYIDIKFHNKTKKFINAGSYGISLVIPHFLRVKEYRSNKFIHYRTLF